MAIKPIGKRPAQDMLATGDNSQEFSPDEFKTAALLPISPNGQVQYQNVAGWFLLNPSSWQESKSVNWNEKIVPGNSDPVLQWSSSGARTVSFEALVTKDTYNDLDVNAVQSAQNKSSNSIINSVASIAANFFSVNTVNQKSTLVASSTQAQITEKLGITDQLNYFRALAYPTYNENHKLQSSPPLLVLVDGNAITKLTLGDTVSENDDIWVLKDLSINITKQLPNLIPMEATVTFTLIQYNIFPFSSDRFSSVF